MEKQTQLRVRRLLSYIVDQLHGDVLDHLDRGVKTDEDHIGALIHELDSLINEGRAVQALVRECEGFAAHRAQLDQFMAGGR